MDKYKIEKFFEEYYPGVVVKTITAATPDELEQKLRDEDYDEENEPPFEFNPVGVHGPPVLSPPERKPMEGYKDTWDFWRQELVAMGVGMYKILDAGNDENIKWAQYLMEAGIKIIVRIYQAEQFPFGLNADLRSIIRKWIEAGVLFIEIGNEPNLDYEYHLEFQPHVDWHNTDLVGMLGRGMWDSIQYVVSLGGRPAIYAMAPTDRGEYRPNATASSVEWLRALLTWVAENHFEQMKVLLQEQKVWLAVHTSPFTRDLDFDPGPVPKDDMCMLGYTVYQEIVEDLFNVTPLTISTEGGAYSPEHLADLGWLGYSTDEEWATKLTRMYDWLQERKLVVCSWILTDEGVDVNQPWINNGWYKGKIPRQVVSAMKERARQ